MDEKALKKLVELIGVLTKMKIENNSNKQGFNDRLVVASDIYQRNKEDKEFVTSLSSSITDSNEEIYRIILNYN